MAKEGSILRECRSMRAPLVRLRHATSLLLAAALSVRVVAAAPPQPPATPPNDVSAASAKRHFEAGIKLYNEKVYAAALAEFEESYRLGGKWVALKNAAQCRRDLKQFAEAYDAYRQLIALHGNDLKPKDKTDVEKAIEELAKVIATIEFVVEPAGAEVSIDGKALGEAPIKPVHVDVGAHDVRVTKAGFLPFQKQLTVVSEQRATLTATLAAEVTTGHVVVNEPGGLPVKVLVDDKEVGSSPWEGDLAPGSHTVQLLGEGLASDKRTIDVQVRGRLELSLPALAIFGRVDLRVVPATGEIVVDGKSVGRGAYVGALEPGQHTIEVSAPGYLPQKTTLAVERGKAIPLVVTLVEEKATVAPKKPRKTSDDDAPPPPPPAKVDRFRGTYGRLSISFLYPLTGSISASEMAPIPSGDPGTKSRTDYFGGGATLRVGYNFDPFALEFAGGFSRSQYTNQLEFTDATEKLSFATMGGFAGIGARVTSRDDAVRVSAGVTIGAVYRYTQITDAWSSPSDTTGLGLSNDVDMQKISPMFGFDAELVLGQSPGTRFVLGVESWLELLGSESLTFGDRTFAPHPPSHGPYVVSKGAVFYVGPHLGLQFGR
jgi:hypothetical protein